jgi:hypothetical protein
VDAGADILQVRSYRVCFELERRIHKIDQWRLPLPYGLPLAGLLYFGCLLIGIVVASGLPGLELVLGGIHPSVRFIAVPVLGSYALLRWRVDGRPAHRTLVSWIRMQVEPSRIAAYRRAPAPGPVRFASITFAPDECGPRLRPGVVKGTGQVTFRYPVETRVRGRALHVRGAGDKPLWQGKQLQLRAGQRVVIE